MGEHIDTEPSTLIKTEIKSSIQRRARVLLKCNLDMNISAIEKKRRKRCENYHKRWARLSEEQRKEFNRQRRAKVTDETRRRNAEYYRRTRNNVTEEQRTKRAISRRERHINMTEAQRLHQLEYKREYQAKKLKEKRLKRLDKLRSNLTEEQCANLTAEHRANLTEEQCIRLIEEERLRKLEQLRINLIEERSAKISEERHMKRGKSHCKHQAKILEEQHIKRLEYERKEHDLKMEEMRKKKLECDRKWKLSVENPLQKLINEMIRNSLNVDIIICLDKKLFIKILRMFEINHSSQNTMMKTKCKLKHLKYKIDVNYLLGLLRRWKGWKITDNFEYLRSEMGYDDLHLYLKNNLTNYRTLRNKYIKLEFTKIGISENCVTATCSLNQLKTLFYHNPQNYIKYYKMKNSIPDLLSDYTGSISHYIINCPYVSTRITLPNFSMTHQNDHSDEYTLLNITNEPMPIFVKNDYTNVFIKMIVSKNLLKIYMKNKIEKFLSSLKDALINVVCDDVSFVRKCEIISVLSEFEKDIAHCPDNIEINSKYLMSLTPYPYVRYLCYPDSGDMCISIADQKVIKNPIINVRLQQMRYPKISFVLEKFRDNNGCGKDDIRFVYNEILHRQDSCISYNCMLCKEYLGSTSPSQIINDHFLKYHGLEPNWQCVNCFNSFTNNYLINNNWWHDCK